MNNNRFFINRPFNILVIGRIPIHLFQGDPTPFLGRKRIDLHLDPETDFIFKEFIYQLLNSTKECDSSGMYMCQWSWFHGTQPKNKIWTTNRDIRHKFIKWLELFTMNSLSIIVDDDIARIDISVTASLTCRDDEKD